MQLPRPFLAYNPINRQSWPMRHRLKQLRTRNSSRLSNPSRSAPRYCPLERNLNLLPNTIPMFGSATKAANTRSRFRRPISSEIVFLLIYVANATGKHTAPGGLKNPEALMDVLEPGRAKCRIAFCDRLL